MTRKLNHVSICNLIKAIKEATPQSKMSGKNVEKKTIWRFFAQEDKPYNKMYYRQKHSFAIVRI